MLYTPGWLLSNTYIKLRTAMRVIMFAGRASPPPENACMSHVPSDPFHRIVSGTLTTPSSSYLH